MSEELEPIIKEALETSRTKETFLRKGGAIARAADESGAALAAGRTLFLIGEGALADVARAAATIFLEGEGAKPLRAIVLADPRLANAGEPLCVRQVDALVASGDVVCALCLDGATVPVAKALETARAQGAKTIVLSGAPGVGLPGPAEIGAVVQARRPAVLAEVFLAALGCIQSRANGRAPEKVADEEPDPRPEIEAAADEVDSTEDVILAEPVEPLPGHLAQVTLEAVPLPPPPPGTIRFRCTKCGEAITVERRYANRRGQCPRCLGEFVIPRHDSGARRALKVSGVKPLGERRRAVRVEVKDAQVLWGRAGWPLPGAPGGPLEDLSLTGCSVKLAGATPPEVAVGDELWLGLDIPAFVEPLRLMGEVRRLSAQPNATSIGIRFTKLDVETQQKIKRLIENVALRSAPRRK